MTRSKTTIVCFLLLVAGSISAFAQVGNLRLHLQQVSSRDGSELASMATSFTGTGRSIGLPEGGEEPKYGAGPEATKSSILVPGRGLVQTSLSPNMKILAPLCYVLVGAGIGGFAVFKMQYAKYHKATDQAEIDRTYFLANTGRKVFVISTSVGLGIWILQIAATNAYGKMNDHYRERSKIWKENELSFAPGYDPYQKSISLHAQVKFGSR